MGSVGARIRVLRRRRSTAVLLVCVLVLVFQIFQARDRYIPPPVKNEPNSSDVLSEKTDNLELAATVLDQLPVKGRAPKTGYSRAQFSDGWAQVEDCDIRNLILARDLSEVRLSSDGCTVLSGLLLDPYTAKNISFVRGADSSAAVQIDHVVALSDAWQKGAQELSAEERFQFANDALNLLAVDGDANQQKGGSDAASWLPASKDYRCRYVARQVAVKRKYKLWVSDAERSSIRRVLGSCEGQPVPLTE